ncbi:MAG: hypothetical protein HYT07_02710 [Candidatus Levybacteria bacterium]|nr:hypothetical protein [Candidatus Levybacteria bacterium]
MKKSSFVILLFIITIVSLSVAQGVVSNKLSTKGVILHEIEKKVYDYKTQNSILSEEILYNSSLTNLASKAAELGFGKLREQFVLNSGSSLAVKP